MSHAPEFAAARERRLLIDVLAMLVIGLIAVVGYKLSPLVVPAAETRVLPDPACNLNRAPCTVAVAGGRLEVSVAPQPIPLIKPIRLEVRAVGVAPSRIDADFAGIGMNMGLNRPQLVAQGAGVYVAETSLPVCITGRMSWELTLMLEVGGAHVLVPFRFNTPDDGGGA